MRRAPDAGRRAATVLAAALLVAVLVSFVPAGTRVANAATLPATFPPSPNGGGGRSVNLTINSTTVAAGNPVVLVLRVVPMNCAVSAPANESVTEVEVHFGDGYALTLSSRLGMAPPLPSPSGCDRAPWNSTLPLSYAYRSAGIYEVTAVVTWADGVALTSNPVSAVITAPSTAVVTALEEWLFGGALVATGTLAACLVLRERLPESPSLPPKEV